MVGRIKTFFSNVKKKFSFVEFVVGGYNLSTGLNSVINSINNYLAYGEQRARSLRCIDSMMADLEILCFSFRVFLTTDRKLHRLDGRRSIFGRP